MKVAWRDIVSSIVAEARIKLTGKPFPAQCRRRAGSSQIKRAGREISSPIGAAAGLAITGKPFPASCAALRLAPDDVRLAGR
jgi:hypothetical protein